MKTLVKLYESVLDIREIKYDQFDKSCKAGVITPNGKIFVSNNEMSHKEIIQHATKVTGEEYKNNFDWLRFGKTYSKSSYEGGEYADFFADLYDNKQRGMFRDMLEKSFRNLNKEDKILIGDRQGEYITTIEKYLWQ